MGTIQEDLGRVGRLGDSNLGGASQNAKDTCSQIKKADDLGSSAHTESNQSEIWTSLLQWNAQNSQQKLIDEESGLIPSRLCTAKISSDKNRHRSCSNAKFPYKIE